MKISVLTHWEQICGLGGWEDLVIHCGASPYSSPTYVIPWWREFNKGRLCCVTAEEDEQLVGLLLAYELPLFPGRWEVELLGSGNGEVHQVLVAEDRSDVTESLWEALLGDPRRQLRLRDLVEVPSSAPLETQAGRARITSSLPRRVIDIVDEQRADDEGQTQESAHSIDIVRARTPEAVQSLAPDFLEHQSKGQTNDFGPRYAAFVLSMLDASARRGVLSIHTVREDGEVAAVSICLHGGSVSAVWGPSVRRRDGVSVPPSLCELLVRDVTREAQSRGAERLILQGDRLINGSRPFRLLDVEALVRPRLPERVSGWLH